MDREAKKKLLGILFGLPVVPGILLFKRYGMHDVALTLVFMFWLTGLLCLLNGYFANRFYKVSQKLLKALGNVIAAIALVIVYFAAIIPTGLIMKPAGRDRLRLKKPEGNSYWKDSTEEVNYEFQF